jgi:hypothetical protein
MNPNLLFARRFVSIAAIASTVAACSAEPVESTESTGSTDSTEILPDATALLALETESLPLSDSTTPATADANPTAEVPDFCADERLQKAFLVGEKRGSRWVQWLWHHFRCCDKIEKFTDALAVLVEKIDERTATEKGVPRCRHAGIVEGVVAEMERLQTQCQADCYAKGESVGAVEAKTYCELAIAAAGQLQPSAWTRQPVGLCGFAYEMGCDAKFLGATTSYVNSQGACAPYTSDPYAEIWKLSRLKTCDYNRRSASKSR